MVQTFAGNENNDIYIGDDGNLAVLHNEEAVLDACATAVKAQKGEMIYKINSGMPNFQTIWSGHPNLLQFQAALRTVLLAVSGVVDIVSVESSIENNELSYSVKIQTIYSNQVRTINGSL